MRFIRGGKQVRYLKNFRNPTFLNAKTGKPLPNTGAWQDRHCRALVVPRVFERQIVSMIEAWASYADEHAAHYNSKIGDDAYAGEHWRDIGLSIAALLNCETGRLDCGTLSGFINDTLASEGFKCE